MQDNPDHVRSEWPADLVVGLLDLLEYDPARRRFTVAGWAVTQAGAAQRYEVVATDGRRVSAGSTLRPDLAARYPHIRNIRDSGFEVVAEPFILEPGQAVESAIILVEDGVDVGAMPFGFRRPAREIAVPEPDFIRRVAGSDSQAYYLASGNRHAQDVARMLRPHRDADSVRAFLDWGCGCGRITRHLLEAFPAAEAHGTDIDHEAIDWLTAAIPDGEFHATGLLPPLQYAAERFDFVLASSVFTHLTAAAQKEWLDELRRVLRPGGILMATTHGEFAASWLRDPEIDSSLGRTGFFDAARDDALDHIAADYYRSTFQTADYTRAHWLDDFEELALHPAALNFHQDVWVLRRR